MLIPNNMPFAPNHSLYLQLYLVVMKKELKYLSFQGGSRPHSGPLGQQLSDLQIRANFIRNVQQNPNTYIDPVLRFHLGLDPVKPKK